MPRSRGALCQAYIIAWDTVKDGPRLFRMDRIRSVKVLEDRRFGPRPMELVLGVCPDAQARGRGAPRGG